MTIPQLNLMAGCTFSGTFNAPYGGGMSVENLGPSPKEKEESERQAALSAYKAARGIKDGEEVEGFDLIYQGWYESWVDFAEVYAYSTENFQAMIDHFDYRAFEEDLRGRCEVEETTSGVTVRDFDLDGGEKLIKAKSFSDYARKVAKRTIIDPEDYIQLDSYCDYEALAEELKACYFSCPARSGIFIFWDI